MSTPEHLSLKLMRLGRATLEPQPLVAITEAINDAFEHLPHKQPTPITDEGLLLCNTPLVWHTNSSSTISKGENLHAVIVVTNDSPMTLIDVAVKATLLREDEKHRLYDSTSSPLKSLGSKETIEARLKHQVLHLGPHTLAVSVTYFLAVVGDAKVMRQNFRFLVASGWDITHRVAHLGLSAALEVTLRNASLSSLFLEDASITCTDGLHGERLVNLPAPASAVRTGGVFFSRPGDVHTLLFSLTPSKSNPIKHLEQCPVFGSLSLSWTSLGNCKGTIKDYVIGNPTHHPSQPSLEIRVSSCPNIVKTETAFSVILEVLNGRDSVVNAVMVELDFSQLNPICVASDISFPQELTDLMPGRSQSITVPLLVPTPGRHFIRGVSVRDAKSKRVWRMEPTPVLAF